GATISINGEAISNTGTDDAKDLNKASARLEYTEVAYDGKAKYPKISIVDANNNLLELGKDYIPFYSNNVNKGVASVTVYGIGAYSGSKTLSFIISDKKADTQPPSLGKVNFKAKNIKKKAVKLSWKKIKNANGYTVQYALNKKFTKKKKTVNVKASKTSKTIKKLKKKKTYYFRARAYCNYKGKKVYGKWSKVKKVKIKK
ncbi:MAG: fibronectin type III domain-containing protein, partial [Eubacterium sp.]|nr:fibronectin type III domain-containing protein [Eubacterium sp.]